MRWGDHFRRDGADTSDRRKATCYRAPYYPTGRSGSRPPTTTEQGIPLDDTVQGRGCKVDAYHRPTRVGIADEKTVCGYLVRDEELREEVPDGIDLVDVEVRISRPVVYWRMNSRGPMATWYIARSCRG